MVAHPFHIHDVQFHVLDVNGNPPPPELKGYKDVIVVKPFETVRFITKFEDFSDAKVPYMYHCHLLHHEDDGMMGNFLVIDTTGTTGVSNHYVDKDNFRIYQDFMNHELTAVIHVEKKQAAEIFIADVLGRRRKNAWIGSIQPGETTVKLNIADLIPGTYFIIYNGVHTWCKKIIR
jgi:bilirubin oxidase